MERSTHTPEKYALVGAASTGKTTLFEALREEFRDISSISFVNEAGRRYFQEHPEIPPNQVFSVPIQTELQQIILKNEIAAAENNPEIIFCDRSVLDSPAHLYAFGNEEGAEKLLNNVRFWLPTYSGFLILNPEDVPYEQDEIRREPKETRDQIHQAFLDFFTRHGIPFQLISGTKKERLTKVKQLINKSE